METLKEIFMIGLVLAVVFAIAHLLVGLYWRWQNRKGAKISEDYRKAVEKHQLSDMKMSTYPDLPMRKTYNPLIGRKVIYQSTTNDVITNSVPASLLDSNRNLWDSEPIRETERLLDSLATDYSGAGHGGSFGGGGASSSWGSDDNGSSSYSDSSSDS